MANTTTQSRPRTVSEIMAEMEAEEKQRGSFIEGVASDINSVRRKVNSAKSIASNVAGFANDARNIAGVVSGEKSVVSLLSGSSSKSSVLGGVAKAAGAASLIAGGAAVFKAMSESKQDESMYVPDKAALDRQKKQQQQYTETTGKKAKILGYTSGQADNISDMDMGRAMQYGLVNPNMPAAMSYTMRTIENTLGPAARAVANVIQHPKTLPERKILQFVTDGLDLDMSAFSADIARPDAGKNNESEVQTTVPAAEKESAADIANRRYAQAASIFKHAESSREFEGPEQYI